MIKYKIKKEPIQHLDTFICDRCKKEISSEDLFQIQETYSINFIGGYASIFGDCNEVDCDLCQECLYELIKDFCRYPDYEDDEADEYDVYDV